MLLAHGPLGYLIAHSTKRYWGATQRSKKQRTILYVTAFVAGILPDIDLLYFYFVDAMQSHRQLPTHSLLPYLTILIIGVTCYYLFRKPFWSIVLIFSGVGAISHLMADSIIGFTILLSPFSDQLFGLPNLDWWSRSVFMRNALVTIFSLEFIIIVTAVSTCIKNKKMYWSVATGSCIAFFLGLLFVSNHIYPANGLFYYADQDNDGLLNVTDTDIDGDGIANRIDTDIDGDGEDNSLDFYRETFVAEGALYDYTEGISPEVPLRIGLVTTPRLIERMYANTGIFFSVEIQNAYNEDSRGYSGHPQNNDFTGKIENWITWLQHTQQLFPPDTQLNEFDVLFFESGHVGLLVRENGVDHVLEADRSHVYVTTVPLTEVEKREGPLRNVGRILPKPLNKRY